MDGSDADLVARVRAGDKAAFGGLIERHRPMALHLAWRILGSHSDAEDIVQEACLQAFFSLHRLRAPERFGAWLGGMALNLARMRVRARRVAYSLDDWVGGGRAKGFTLAETQPTPEAAYEALELHRLVLSAIAKLPAAQQEAMRQYYWDGLSITDIGFIAGVSASTVRVRLSRARERLRAGLARDLESRPLPAKRRNEGPTMIEVFVHDIVGRLPRRATPEGLAGRPNVIMLPAVVLLKARDRERVLPIQVGPCERDAIAVLLIEMQTIRPLMYEFFAQVLKAASARLKRVAITRLHEDIYYATAWLQTTDGQIHEVDARPSDAITLALRVKAPIFVHETILEQAGIATDSTAAYLDERRRMDQKEGKTETEGDDLDWASILDIARAA
jgi:RNA polymerase sigma factor (sigma-70 family)